jgi:hypothetical protein
MNGIIVTGGLPFAELKTRSLIDTRARAANDSPDFSQLIRVGLPLPKSPLAQRTAFCFSSCVACETEATPSPQCQSPQVNPQFYLLGQQFLEHQRDFPKQS